MTDQELERLMRGIIGEGGARRMGIPPALPQTPQELDRFYRARQQDQEKARRRAMGPLAGGGFTGMMPVSMGGDREVETDEWTRRRDPGMWSPERQPLWNVDPGMKTTMDQLSPLSDLAKMFSGTTGGQNVYDQPELQRAIEGINAVSGGPVSTPSGPALGAGAIGAGALGGPTGAALSGSFSGISNTEMPNPTPTPGFESTSYPTGQEFLNQLNSGLPEQSGPGGGFQVAQYAEPTVIPGAGTDQGFIPGGVNVPTGPEANAVDPFTQLLNQYLNDPSGYLASTGPIPGINNEMPLPVQGGVDVPTGPEANVAGAGPDFDSTTMNILGVPLEAGPTAPFAEPTPIPGASGEAANSIPDGQGGMYFYDENWNWVGSSAGQGGADDIPTAPGVAPAAAPAQPVDTQSGQTFNYSPDLLLPPGAPGSTAGGVQGPLYHVDPQGNVFDKAGNLIRSAAGAVAGAPGAIARGVKGIPGAVGNVARELGTGIRNAIETPGYSSPDYLRSIGYEPGQGTDSLWPGAPTGPTDNPPDSITQSSGGLGGGGVGGEGGSFYGGLYAPHGVGGPLPGSGSVFGQGSHGMIPWDYFARMARLRMLTGGDPTLGFGMLNTAPGAAIPRFTPGVGSGVGGRGVGAGIRGGGPTRFASSFRNPAFYAPAPVPESSSRKPGGGAGITSGGGPGGIA